MVTEWLRVVKGTPKFVTRCKGGLWMRVLRWIIRMWREPFRGLTVDHIVPESRGGVTCIGNSQILPMKVNVNKSDHLYEEMWSEDRVPKLLAGRIYLEHTKGIVCEPCRYDCGQCPFGDVLSVMAMDYSAWVPPKNLDSPNSWCTCLIIWFGVRVVRSGYLPGSSV